MGPTPAFAKTRKLPQGALRLMEAAEELIGERGLGAVSMRQVVSAAEQANPAAVQYHFGSMDGLVEAIFRLRLPVIEARRVELLAELSPAQRRDLRCLLRAIALPLSELRNSKGKLAYARFAAEVGLTSEMPRSWAMPAAEIAPVTNTLVTLLTAAMAPAEPEIMSLRITLAFQLIFRALTGGEANRFGTLSQDDILDYALRMAAAALAAK